MSSPEEFTDSKYLKVQQIEFNHAHPFSQLLASASDARHLCNTMPLIAVTRLRLRFRRYLPLFTVYTLLSTWQAKRAPGNLGVSLLVDANNAYWTRTAWQSEAAMQAFRIAASHKQAMTKLFAWCDEASVVHWTQETPELPDWHEAHQRMVKEGVRGKLKHPSPSHIACEIAAPKFSTKIRI